MDEAGFESAHLVGNSLGGYVALQLAARGRARTVVALAPAGGWASGDKSFRNVLRLQSTMVASGQVRSRPTRMRCSPRRRAGGARRSRITVNYEHIPVELLVHQTLGVARCTAAPASDRPCAARSGWSLDAEKITCPVRTVWGTEDRLLPWPSAAARYREEWLPHADWIELEGVGHCPQLDVPLETAQLILGFTN